ncbi:MAG: hypothetical protein GY788_00170 [bacterium]|nr:hypothetical protein [bacterium]
MRGTPVLLGSFATILGKTAAGSSAATGVGVLVVDRSALGVGQAPVAAIPDAMRSSPIPIAARVMRM